MKLYLWNIQGYLWKMVLKGTAQECYAKFFEDLAGSIEAFDGKEKI